MATYGHLLALPIAKANSTHTIGTFPMVPMVPMVPEVLSFVKHSFLFVFLVL